MARPTGKASWGIELLLAGALALRCVPSFTLKQDGGGGEGGEAGTLAGGSGGSSGVTSGDGGEATGGSAGTNGGTGGDGDSGGSSGGDAGNGGEGNAGGTSPLSGSGGTAGSGRGGSGGATAGAGGVAGAGTGGKAGAGGIAGAGGSGVVRTCGTGGAPYVWANWCMPNHPGQGPHPHSYDTSTPGIVKDRVTGLVWEHPTNAVFAQRTFAQADTHCADLRTSSYGGYDDWRVPSIIELVSITDYAVTDPAIDTAAFPGSPSNTYYWTSHPPEGVEAWIVFANGVVFAENVKLARTVRCVR